MKHRGKFGLCLLATIALPLAACQSGEKGAKPPEENKQAGPDAKPGLSVSGGILVLPAVQGRPGAAYFTLQNDSDGTAELAAVHIDGAANAEMHETSGGTMTKLDKLAVLPGESARFAPGGKHVMAFDLSDQLKPGGTTEMTLGFTDGDKLSAPLAIQAMGAAGQMDGMDHGDTH